MSRYYYTCAIKALYMSLNFGAHLYFESKDGDIEFNPQEYADNVDLWIDGYDGRTKIYVESQSGHIFEPKKGDFISNEDEGLGIITHNKLCNKLFAEFKNGERWWQIKYCPTFKIIMRDNKQFFAAEVENE